MEEKQTDFWQSHSTAFLEMAFRTDRRERPARPDGRGVKTGECGDTVEFFITLRSDRLEQVAYDIRGCIHTNACANTVAELVDGLDIEAAWEITPEKVAHYLETLPADHFHCAELAVGAFYLALADCRRFRL